VERKIIYSVESGSFLYGTNLETSDKDYSSVFMPTPYDLLSLQKCEYIDNSTKSSSEDRRNTEEDVDNQQYSLGRFVHLVLHGNPNLTEILFCKNPIVEDEVFMPLKANIDKLVSGTVYDSFTGFAVSQKKKLQYKSLRFGQLKSALEYFEARWKDEIIDPNAQMSTDAAAWLNKNLKECKGGKNNKESFHQGLPMQTIYERVKEEYTNYGWRVRTDTFETLGYDVKFASHAVRLFHEGERLLTTGKLEFPIMGKAHDDITAIRRGEVSIKEFYRICDEYEDINRKAKDRSVLPEKPDWKWANLYLVDTLEYHIYQAHANKLRGWG
jgi:predicted nucleotidyltransferase